MYDAETGACDPPGEKLMNAFTLPPEGLPLLFFLLFGYFWLKLTPMTGGPRGAQSQDGLRGGGELALPCLETAGSDGGREGTH